MQPDSWSGTRASTGAGQDWEQPSHLLQVGHGEAVGLVDVAQAVALQASWSKVSTLTAVQRMKGTTRAQAKGLPDAAAGGWRLIRACSVLPRPSHAHTPTLNTPWPARRRPQRAASPRSTGPRCCGSETRREKEVWPSYWQLSRWQELQVQGGAASAAPSSGPHSHPLPVTMQRMPLRSLPWREQLDTCSPSVSADAGMLGITNPVLQLRPFLNRLVALGQDHKPKHSPGRSAQPLRK